MAIGRGVFWEKQFEDELAALQPEPRRVDEARQYIEELTRFHPEQGLPTDYPGVRLVPVVLPVGGSLMPLEASVFYIYDDQSVYVLSIKPKPDSEAELAPVPC